MKNVLFDMDGVLVDSRRAISGAHNYALERHGYGRRPVEELHRLIGPPLAFAFEQLLGLPHDGPEIAELVKTSRARYVDSSLEETVVFDGITTVLEDLRASGHRLAVATSKPHRYAVPILERLGLLSHFEHVAGPDTDSLAQSKRLMIAEALAALGTGTAVMIGDTRYDIDGARHHEIPVIGALWGIGSSDELAAADRLVSSPTDLPTVIGQLLSTESPHANGR